MYANAWTAVRDIVHRCHEAGIGVLLDLHALPGGANKDAHSGTGSGKAEFWGNRKYRDIGKECAVFLVKEASAMPGVAGVQIVNEAGWGAGGMGMWEWYENVLDAVKQVDTSMPIYISDAWELSKVVKWTKERNAKGHFGNPVVIDTHKYYTFGDEHRKLAPQQIISRVPKDMVDTSGTSIIVGEYSCVLDGQTWSKCNADEKPAHVRDFGHAQSHAWQSKTSGSYFWTLKMDWMDGGEWGFVEQAKKGNITPPAYMLLSNQEVQDRASAAQGRKGQLASEARRGHEEYWNGAAPGKKMDHARFSDGWSLGFEDAAAFFTMRCKEGVRSGGDKIGCLELWVRKRVGEGRQQGEFEWEFEQGVRAGIVGFYTAAGI